MAFPLFDLPAEAVDLVLGSVDDLEDKRALRLVCKRSRASVDSRGGPLSGRCNLISTIWAKQGRRPWLQRTSPPSKSSIFA